MLDDLMRQVDWMERARRYDMCAFYASGHKSIDTTMGYIHVNEAQMREAISSTFDTSWCRASRTKRKPLLTL